MPDVEQKSESIKETFVSTLNLSRSIYYALNVFWQHYDGVANMPEWKKLKDTAFQVYNTHLLLMGIRIEQGEGFRLDILEKQEHQTDKTYVLFLLQHALDAMVELREKLTTLHGQHPDLFQLRLFQRLEEHTCNFTDPCYEFFHIIDRYEEDDSVFDSNA